MTVRGSSCVDDGVLVAEAEPGEVPEPVEAVDPADAGAAEHVYAGLLDHPFPSCFVCGTEPAEGVGMRLRPGQLTPGRTACTWTPQPTHLETAHVWAALDCPGGWTGDLVGRPMVLGRITAVIRRRPLAGERLVVVGALVDAVGRKSRTATSVYDAAGREVGSAFHTWIRVDPPTFDQHSAREHP